jgi:hypothetical protein
MAACAWNLRKWLAIATIFLFWQKLGLFFVKYPYRFYWVLIFKVISRPVKTTPNKPTPILPTT